MEKTVNDILSKFFIKENDFFVFKNLKILYVNGYLNISGKSEFDMNGIKTTYNVCFSYEIKNENDVYFIVNYWINLNDFSEKII